mmetsp:Transcript_25865/g.49744  ORF Transcript_25865/g.49744 Transcript_25865/m.49744 type:complete len:90 (-) Transcript_25865:264-533(-)
MHGAIGIITTLCRLFEFQFQKHGIRQSVFIFSREWMANGTWIVLSTSSSHALSRIRNSPTFPIKVHFLFGEFGWRRVSASLASYRHSIT